jgi:hypothetical protein
MKPGWKTTEFWQTLAVVVINGLVVLGVVPPADGTTLGGALAQGIAGAFAVVANALVVTQYVRGRVALKQQP